MLSDEALVPLRGNANWAQCIIRMHRQLRDEIVPFVSLALLRWDLVRDFFFFVNSERVFFVNIEVTHGDDKRDILIPTSLLRRGIVGIWGRSLRRTTLKPDAIETPWKRPLKCDDAFWDWDPGYRVVEDGRIVEVDENEDQPSEHVIGEDHYEAKRWA
jgi:hypothetical protein